MNNIGKKILRNNIPAWPSAQGMTLGQPFQCLTFVVWSLCKKPQKNKKHRTTESHKCWWKESLEVSGPAGSKQDDSYTDLGRLYYCLSESWVLPQQTLTNWSPQRCKFPSFPGKPVPVLHQVPGEKAILHFPRCLSFILPYAVGSYCT